MLFLVEIFILCILSTFKGVLSSYENFYLYSTYFLCVNVNQSYT